MFFTLRNQSGASLKYAAIVFRSAALTQFEPFSYLLICWQLTSSKAASLRCGTSAFSRASLMRAPIARLMAGMSRFIFAFRSFIYRKNLAQCPYARFHQMLALLLIVLLERE